VGADAMLSALGAAFRVRDNPRLPLRVAVFLKRRWLFGVLSGISSGIFVMSHFLGLKQAPFSPSPAPRSPTAPTRESEPLLQLGLLPCFAGVPG